MSVEMKLGRWEARDGTTHVIDQYDGMFWKESSSGHWWNNKGWFHAKDEVDDGDPWDLIRYLGPLELSPSPACAEAGPAGDPQTVSTETAGEQLRRVNARLNSIRSELGICRASVKALERAESDLEELAKRLEKEVEKSPSGNHEAAACAVIQDERREG